VVSNLYTVINDSPYITTFVVITLANTISTMWNRFWRHFNIRKHGYPPPHCDADGDFKPPSKNS
jgi:hypothetical protein